MFRRIHVETVSPGDKPLQSTWLITSVTTRQDPAQEWNHLFLSRSFQLSFVSYFVFWIPVACTGAASALENAELLLSPSRGAFSMIRVRDREAATSGRR
jgi:hypothetical protein